MKAVKPISCIMLVCLQSAVFAAQPDVNLKHTLPDWRGFYFGITAGGISADFQAKTYTQAGSLLSATQAGIVNQNGNQSLTPDGFLAGLTGGYNWQINRFLIGIEGDVQSLSISDTMNSGAQTYAIGASSIPIAGGQFVVTSYGSQNWLFSFRPRVGVVTNGGLFYITGGPALSFVQADFMFTDDSGSWQTQRVREYQTGYTAGAGFETGLTDHVSMKLEYLYTDFGTSDAYQMTQITGQGFQNSVNLHDNIVRLGLNYHFNAAAGLSPQFIPMLFTPNNWQAEIGARAFFSTGENGSPNPLLGDPGDVLASRLVFKDLEALSLETYARLDHTSGVFVKGNLGAGNMLKGNLHDEDFPAGGAYSNTLSQALGNISYGTVDVGYSLFHSAPAKSGLFIGYNYYAQNINVYGCRQLAGAGVCRAASDFENVLGISEYDYYKSLRVGVISKFDITDRLNFSAEAAYLPVVHYSGQDNHNLRQLILPEHSNTGNGSMLESVLSYQVSDNWQIGVGGRYWAWNMHNGSVTFDFQGFPPALNEPARYNTYRYGGFVEINYLEKPLNHFQMSHAPVTWRGWYVGGNLGGAWGNSDWSDPFGASPGIGSAVNRPGFGDSIYANGPLAGIDLHYYWQSGRYVYGIGGNIGFADMRGENTLFSGMGGVNGQSDTRYFMTLVGKFGVTCDRSLFYVNLGPAFLQTKYHINANADFLLGAQYQTLSQIGGTIGAGIDYALSDSWTTNVEYDYIRIPHDSISFSEIVLINEHSYAINQSMNIFKVGINYKFL